MFDAIVDGHHDSTVSVPDPPVPAAATTSFPDKTSVADQLAVEINRSGDLKGGHTGNGLVLGDEMFDEALYLQQYPEIATAIAEGHLPNAEFHYRVFASGPRRLREDAFTRRADISLPGCVDAAFFSPSGALFLIGWLDDRAAPLTMASITFDAATAITVPAIRFARFRRPDADAMLGFSTPSHLGFCCLVRLNNKSTRAGLRPPRLARLQTSDGASAEIALNPTLMGDIELRDLMLGYIAAAEFVGNKHVELFQALQPGFGDTLIDHNRALTQNIVSGAICERFDSTSHPVNASIIVCLYGKPEFQFIQNALFSTARTSTEYEYIFVSNSPELLEELCKTATISKHIYGLNISLVMLPGNAGFGAANNIAARFARSKRLLIVNPDVFPMDCNWVDQHNDLINQLDSSQTRLFGARLFYADGSLMHAGMYLDVDFGTSVSGLEIRRQPMLRVEHFGKGAPKQFKEFKESRAVTAVSGAFMSIDRGCFEQLNGFAEDYIFGHYEDADFCLRARERGVLTWIHPLDLWHLEGKGSVRLSHHEGASHVNRWLFTRTWHNKVVPTLLGRTTPVPPLYFDEMAS